MTVTAGRRPGGAAPESAPAGPAPRPRPAWRSVALPSEHGGWGLTLEPAVLGLALCPSFAGLALGLAGLLTFVLRTPLKLALVDRRRQRRLPRTRLATRIAVAEGAAVVALGAAAVALGGWTWLVPVALAAPAVGVELWFDARSRSRRLLPELCGALGMAALASAVVLAGGGSAGVALVAWGLLAGRSLAAIPHVRVQILRLRTGRGPVGQSDLAQLAGTALAASMVVVEPAAAAGAVAVAATAVVRLVGVRRPPLRPALLGMVESVLGVAVVVVAAIGLHIGGAV